MVPFNWARNRFSKVREVRDISACAGAVLSERRDRAVTSCRGMPRRHWADHDMDDGEPPRSLVSPRDRVLL